MNMIDGPDGRAITREEAERIRLRNMAVQVLDELEDQLSPQQMTALEDELSGDIDLGRLNGSSPEDVAAHINARVEERRAMNDAVLQESGTSSDRLARVYDHKDSAHLAGREPREIDPDPAEGHSYYDSYDMQRFREKNAND
jgi:hypothetical protein